MAISTQWNYPPLELLTATKVIKRGKQKDQAVEDEDNDDAEIHFVEANLSTMPRELTSVVQEVKLEKNSGACPLHPAHSPTPAYTPLGLPFSPFACVSYMIATPHALNNLQSLSPFMCLV